MAIHLRYFTRPSKDHGVDILLPPDASTPCPDDCMECEANDLAAVDRLQHALQNQTYRRCQRELESDEQAFAAARERVRANLYSRLTSAATSEYEKEFLRCYLELREEKRAKYRARFTCDTAYLELRENDRARNAEELLKESL